MTAYTQDEIRQMVEARAAEELSAFQRQNEQLIARLFIPSPGEPDDQLTLWLSRHLKFLIFAAHPDRNGGSKQAGEVTRLLLDFREKRKTRADDAGLS